MKFVYKKYILYKDVKWDQHPKDKDKNPKSKDIFIEKHSVLMNTGVDKVNNKKQVYFIIDTIDGKVTDSNKHEYYCPFM